MKTDEVKVPSDDTEQAGPACEETTPEGAAASAGPASAQQPDPSEEWKNRAVYLMAEIENMRKRFAREKSDLIRFAGEEAIKTVLPILDNLQLAVKAAKDAEAKGAGENKDLVGRLLQGVEMTVKHFEQTLERMGVQFVPAVGQNFDPEKHEAIAQAESPDHKDGEVTAEMQRGYTLHGRVIRPARVVVNKMKS